MERDLRGARAADELSGFERVDPVKTNLAGAGVIGGFAEARGEGAVDELAPNVEPLAGVQAEGVLDDDLCVAVEKPAGR